MSRTVISLSGAMALALALTGSALAVQADDDAGPANSAATSGPLVCGQGFVYSSLGQECVVSRAAAPVTCTTGSVYDKDTRACVQLEAGLHDRQLYQQGRLLALAGEYDDALGALQAVSVENADVLTMIGYATRKLGNLDEGIAIYHQALAIDPDNLNTHEYLGEGYLDAGRIDLAEAELDTLEALCGTGCQQFQDLAKAIAGDTKWN